MAKHIEGAIEYEFPDSLVVLRLGNSAFYRKHWRGFAFSGASMGNKEVDFLFFDPVQHRLWMVETKDYRHRTREKATCALHIEQSRGSKLFPTIVDAKSLRDGLRRRLRPLDPHAMGGSTKEIGADLPFSISA